MKKLSIIAFLIVVAATTAFGQKSQNKPFEQTNADARKIIQYMTDWADLSNRKDYDALDKLLPVDLVITFQDGEVLTKDEYIASLRKNPGDFNITDYDQKVDLFNDRVAELEAGDLISIIAREGETREQTEEFLKNYRAAGGE